MEYSLSLSLSARFKGNIRSERIDRTFKDFEGKNFN